MPLPPSFSNLPTSMSIDEFWKLVGVLEYEQLDFKQGASDLTSLIVAFAMTDGGWAVLGVGDDRTIVGCPLTQKVLDKVTRAGHQCDVDVQLREVGVGKYKLTFVAVPEVRGRIVTTPDGRLLRRVGSDNQPLVGDSLSRFVREREERPSDEVPLPVFGTADLDLRAVNEVLRREGRSTVRRDGLMRALVDLGAALPDDNVTGPRALSAAVILFAQDPRKYLQGACVQAVRRTGTGPGPGPTAAREEFAGPLESVLREVLQFAARHTQRYAVVVGTHREALSEYPEEVLREAMLNALAHRDYGLVGSTIDVTVWDDRIEIQSPGGLPGHITVENMRHEHYSRNRRLMRVLKMSGLVEEYGEGVDRMIHEMEARLMEPPLFVATSSSVIVTLRNRFLVSVEDQAWLSLLGGMQLGPIERRVLVLARREGSVTPRRLRQALPGSDIENVLRTAVAKGLLVRVGQAGGVRYQLSDEVVIRVGSTGLEARSRARQLILDEMQSQGSISTAEAADLVNESQAIVRHLLADLVRSGLAEPRGRTRARRYFPI